MIKLLMCLVCAFLIGVAMLQLRQQELELKHEGAALQQKIQSQQAHLWNQQLQIAILTSPNTLTRSLNRRDLSLVPQAKLPPDAADWIRLSQLNLDPAARSGSAR
jgi:cell division protein FtsL